MRKLKWSVVNKKLWVAAEDRLDYSITKGNDIIGPTYAVCFSQDGGAESHLVTVGGGDPRTLLDRAKAAAQDHVDKLIAHHVTGEHVIKWASGPYKGQPLTRDPGFKDYLKRRFS